jgi:hypothetical protein
VEEAERHVVVMVVVVVCHEALSANELIAARQQRCYHRHLLLVCVTLERPCAWLQMQYQYRSRLRSRSRLHSDPSFSTAAQPGGKEVPVLAEAAEEDDQLMATLDHLRGKKTNVC